MIEKIRRFFRKTETPEVTPYTHWPQNIRVFYPDIYERDRYLPVRVAIERQYPEVLAMVPLSAGFAGIFGYIEQNKVEPQ